MFHAEKRLFALMLLFTPIVAADEFTWTGGGANTAWSNPENWSNDSGGAAMFPTAADNVTFPTDAVTTNGSALGLTNSAVLQAGLGTISLAGGPVTNTGLITFEGHGSTGNEVYSLSADTTFSGTGTLRLKELNDSFIVGAGALTNGVGHTLRGSGRVEVPVVNQGQLVAEGGVLHLSGGVLENSAGAITLAADGVLTAASTLIEGGALHGEVGGSLGSGGTLRGVATTGQIAQQAGVTFLEGVIANSGRLTYQAGGSTADEVYQLVGAVTLAGVGELVLQEATDSFLTGDGPLTQDGGHVLRGSGQLPVDVINHNGSVMVDPDARLFVTDRTISGGTVAFDATGRLQGTPTLKNLTLSGTAVRSPGVTQLEGTLTNLGEITYEASGSTADEVYRLAADVTLAGAGVLRLREANDSFITGAVGTEVLTNGPNHTLRGAGQINTAIINQNLIIAEQGVLTLAGGAVDNTQGSIGVAADGTLTATGTTISGGSIAFAPGSTLGDGGTLDSLATTGVVRQRFGATSLMGTITNNGELTYIESGSTANAAYQLATDVTLNGAGTLRLIELNDHFVTGALGDEVLTNGPNHTVRGAGDIGVSIVNQGALVAERGTLRVTGSTVDNAGGVIVVGSDGLLSAASVIHDGVLQAELGALIGDGATLRDLQLVGQLTQSFGVTRIDGTITNHGLLTYINDISTANAVIRVDGAATLTGSGTLRLTELNDAFLDGAGTLTNTGGHTIRGTGEINIDILNTGGVIRVDPAAQLRVSGKTITGGVLNSAESGRLIGTPTLRDLTLTGTQVRTFGVTSLGGTLQNNGLMTYERSASTANAVYELVDDVTLSGGGELQLREAQDHYVTGLTGDELLTNGAGHTLSGSGQVQVEVLNEGTVQPGAAMSLTQGYTQGATAELLANNVDLVDWSELMVAGAAMLDGGLVIDYVGLIPVGVHTFDLLKADSISGDFTGLTIVDALPWVGTASYEILPDEIGVTDVLRVTVENAASGLPGDYNNDGFVDAADYTTWRDLSGRNYPMPNDVTPGVVDAADYAVWRANYGAVVAGPAAAAAPEPATLLLLMVAGLTRRVRRWSGHWAPNSKPTRLLRPNASENKPRPTNAARCIAHRWGALSADSGEAVLSKVCRSRSSRPTPRQAATAPPTAMPSINAAPAI